MSFAYTAGAITSAGRVAGADAFDFKPAATDRDALTAAANLPALDTSFLIARVGSDEALALDSIDGNSAVLPNESVQHVLHPPQGDFHL